MGNFNSSNIVTCSYLKLFVRTLAMLGFILILLVGTLESEAESSTKSRTTIKAESSTKSRTTIKAEFSGDVKGKVTGRENLLVNRPQLDLFHVNKRRVPNGPDPIHNRRAGNSGRPPKLNN